MMEAGWSIRGVVRQIGPSDLTVKRPRGERFNPAFALQRHTAPAADLMRNVGVRVKLATWQLIELRRSRYAVAPPGGELQRRR
ncbi:hypothetical protein TNCV_2828401 [Trichonephila clavipes]|nr:hypothetical protein TNCV_2828401 [Trichonephila clavipes]